MRVCSVYFREGDIYISASAKNTFGIFQDSEPFFKVHQSVAPQELGEKVLAALASYHENAPGKLYVRGVKHAPSPFLIFSGFKSWRAFEKGATHFSVSNHDSVIEFTPSIPAPKGGFLHQPQKAVQCAALPAEVGRLLLEQASNN
jgi:hypothetical protein